MQTVLCMQREAGVLAALVCKLLYVSCCEHRTVSEVGLVFRATQLSCTLGLKHSLTAAGVQLKTHVCPTYQEGWLH